MTNRSTVSLGRRIEGALRAAVLLGSMAALLGAVGWSFAGLAGVFWVMLTGVAYAALTPRVPPRLLLRWLGAREAPQGSPLTATVAELARRAELPVAPRVFVLPRADLNAMTLGSRADPSIAVTRGLLRFLDPRELAGVLAHEVSHVEHDDLRLLGIATAVARLTRSMAGLGWFVLLLSLPLVLLSGGVPWLAVLLLTIGPACSELLWLALSRTREFDADAGAVGLTGDAVGLASALDRLDSASRRVSLWQRWLGRGAAREPVPEILRTHPGTRERVRRLAALHPGARRAA